MLRMPPVNILAHPNVEPSSRNTAHNVDEPHALPPRNRKRHPAGDASGIRRGGEIRREAVTLCHEVVTSSKLATSLTVLPTYASPANQPAT